nr:putative uncharacterized hydrolase ysaa [Quercus suber]
MTASRPLKSFSCLTFDCYGTLIDWEGGIYKALAPLTKQLSTSHPLYNDRLGVLHSYIRNEGLVQTANQNELYSTVLAKTYGNMAAEFGVEANEEEMARFGASVGDWPVYPDTIAALKQLQTHFRLVILSNVDRESFERTLAKQFVGIKFDAIYIAEEIGSYKPDLRNFHYLIEHCQKDLGVSKDGIIHTAQSLYHDIVPATAVGMASAWIERGEDFPSAMGGNLSDLKDQVAFSWQFKNMGEMAAAMDTA